MCTAKETYTEAVKAVNDVLFTKKDGKTRLEREMESAVYQALGKWLIGGGIMVIVFFVGIYYRVQANSEKVDNALSHDQAALIIQRVDQLKEAVDDKNRVIQSIDERLRDKGI